MLSLCFGKLLSDIIGLRVCDIISALLFNGKSINPRYLHLQANKEIDRQAIIRLYFSTLGSNRGK